MKKLSSRISISEKGNKTFHSLVFRIVDEVFKDCDISILDGMELKFSNNAKYLVGWLCGKLLSGKVEFTNLVVLETHNIIQ